MKYCGQCRRHLPLKSFGKHKNRHDGLQQRCRECKADRWLKRQYGLTRKQYQAMYKKVGGKCQLCRRHYKTLCVDHDHTTGEVRGLLCISCNRALGYIDNRAWRRRAVRYLRGL